MPESVCEELFDELFDNPFLTFADYLSLLRRKRIARGFDYDDLLKPFTFSDQLFQSQQRDIVERFYKLMLEEESDESFGKQLNVRHLF